MANIDALVRKIQDEHPLVLEYGEDARYIWPARWKAMKEALTTHFEQQRERDAKARKLIERIQAACGDPDKGRGMRNILEFSSLALALLKEEA